ncbi:MAG: hypothetical protein WC860_03385, partial [Candidatus Margulisiibacteriota bacterium]
MTTVVTPNLDLERDRLLGAGQPEGPGYLVSDDATGTYQFRSDAFRTTTSSRYSVDATDLETITHLISTQFSKNDSSVKSLLDKLKEKGIIDQNMSLDQMAANIHAYFVSMLSNSACDLSKIDPDKLVNFEAAALSQSLIDRGLSATEVQNRVSIVHGRTLFNEPDIRVVYKNQNNEKTGLAFTNQTPTAFDSSIYSNYSEVKFIFANPSFKLGAGAPTAPTQFVDLLGAIPDTINKAGSYIDQNQDNFIKHLTENPPIYYGTKDANGFWHINTEKFTKDLMALTTAWQVMASMVNLANMICDSLENMSLQLMELDPGEFSTSKERQKMAENVNKLSQKSLEGCQTLMNLYWQSIDSLNNAEYQKQKKDIEADYSSRCWSDFITGGEKQKQKEEKTGNLDRNMQSVYQDMVQSYARVQTLLMTNQLMGLSSMDLGNKKAFDDLQKNYEDRIKKAFTNSSDMFIKDTGQDQGGYLKFNDKMFVDAFGAMQQLFAVMRALMMAKQAQINSMQQAARQLNDYAGSSGDLIEVSNNFLELKMNLVQSNLLRVQSLAQSRVSYYNQMRQHEINYTKLQMTQGLKILSFLTLGLLSPITNLITAAIEQAMPQTADTKQTQFADYNEWSRYLNNQPSYVQVNPDDDNTTKGVKNEANMIANLQNKEQYYLQQLSSLSDMVDVGGGRKVVDWAGYTSIMNQLKRLQEAQRAIFQAIKAQVDTIETVAADLADKPKQHLYKQLDRIFDSRFETQQMILEVFKFTLQQTQWANLLNAQVYSGRWSAWINFGFSFIPILGGVFSALTNWFANPYGGGKIHYSELGDKNYNYTGTSALPANLQDKNPGDPAVEAWAHEQWAIQNPGKDAPAGIAWTTWKSETFWNAKEEAYQENLYSQGLVDNGGTTMFMGIKDQSVNFDSFLTTTHEMNQIIIRRTMLAMALSFYQNTLAALASQLKGREAGGNIFGEYMVSMADRLNNISLDTMNSLYQQQQTKSMLQGIKFNDAKALDQQAFKMIIFAASFLLLLIPVVGPVLFLVVAAAALFTPTTDFIYNVVMGNQQNKVDMSTIKETLRRLKAEGKWTEDDEVLHQLMYGDKLIEDYDSSGVSRFFGFSGSYVNWGKQVMAELSLQALFMKKSVLADAMDAVQESIGDTVQDLGGMYARTSWRALKDLANAEKSASENMVNTIMGKAQANVQRDMAIMETRRAALTNIINLVIQIAVILATIATGGIGGAAAGGAASAAAAAASASTAASAAAAAAGGAGAAGAAAGTGASAGAGAASSAATTGTEAASAAERPPVILPITAPAMLPAATVNPLSAISNMISRSISQVAQYVKPSTATSAPAAASPAATLTSEATSASTATSVPATTVTPEATPASTATSVPATTVTPEATPASTATPQAAEGSTGTSAAPQTPAAKPISGTQAAQSVAKTSAGSSIKSFFQNKYVKRTLAFLGYQLMQDIENILDMIILSVYKAKIQSQIDKSKEQIDANKKALDSQATKAYSSLETAMWQSRLEASGQQIEAGFYGQIAHVNAEIGQMIGRMIQNVVSELKKGIKNARSNNGELANNVSQEMLDKASEAKEAGKGLKGFMPSLKEGMSTLAAGFERPAAATAASAAKKAGSSIRFLAGALIRRPQELTTAHVGKDLIRGSFRQAIDQARARITDPKTLAKFEAINAKLEQQIATLTKLSDPGQTAASLRSSLVADQAALTPAVATVSAATPAAPSTTPPEVTAKLQAIDESLKQITEAQGLINPEEMQAVLYFQTASSVVKSVEQMFKAAEVTETPNAFKQFMKHNFVPSFLDNQAFLKELRRNLAASYSGGIASVLMADTHELSQTARNSLAKTLSELVSDSERTIVPILARQLAVSSNIKPEAFSALMTDLLNGDKDMKKVAELVMMSEDFGDRTRAKLLFRAVGLSDPSQYASLSRGQKNAIGEKLITLLTEMQAIGNANLAGQSGARIPYDVMNLNKFRGRGELGECAKNALDSMKPSSKFRDLLNTVLVTAKDREKIMREMAAEERTRLKPFASSSKLYKKSFMALRFAISMVFDAATPSIFSRPPSREDFTNYAADLGSAQMHRSSALAFVPGVRTEGHLIDRVFDKNQLVQNQAKFSEEVSRVLGTHIVPKTDATSGFQLTGRKELNQEINHLLKDYGLDVPTDSLAATAINEAIAQHVDQFAVNLAVANAIESSFSEAQQQAQQTQQPIRLDQVKSSFAQKLKTELEEQAIAFSPVLVEKNQSLLTAAWQNFSTTGQIPNTRNLALASLNQAFSQMLNTISLANEAQTALGFNQERLPEIAQKLLQNHESQNLAQDKVFQACMRGVHDNLLLTTLEGNPLQSQVIVEGGAQLNKLDALVKSLTSQSLAQLTGVNFEASQELLVKAKTGKLASDFRELNDLVSNLGNVEEQAQVRPKIAEVQTALGKINPTNFDQTLPQARTECAKKCSELLKTLGVTSDQESEIKKIFEKTDPAERAKAINDFLNSDAIKNVSATNKLFIKSLLQVTSNAFDAAEILSKLDSTDNNVRKSAITKLNSTEVPMSLFREIKAQAPFNALLVTEADLNKFSFQAKLAALVSSGNLAKANLATVFASLTAVPATAPPAPAAAPIITAPELDQVIQDALDGNPPSDKKTKPLESFIHTSVDLAKKMVSVSKGDAQSQASMQALTQIIHDTKSPERSVVFNRILEKANKSVASDIVNKLMENNLRNTENHLITEAQVSTMIPKLWAHHTEQIKKLSAEKLQALMAKTDPVSTKQKEQLLARMVSLSDGLLDTHEDYVKLQMAKARGFLQATDSVDKVKQLTKPQADEINDLLTKTDTEVAQICTTKGILPPQQSAINRIRERNQLFTDILTKPDADLDKLFLQAAAHRAGGYTLAQIQSFPLPQLQSFQAEVNQNHKDQVINLRNSWSTEEPAIQAKAKIDAFLTDASTQTQIEDLDLVTQLLVTDDSKFKKIAKAKKLSAEQITKLADLRASFTTLCSKQQEAIKSSYEKNFLDDSLLEKTLKSSGLISSQALLEEFKGHLKTQYTSRFDLLSKLTLPLILGANAGKSKELTTMLSDMYEQRLNEARLDGEGNALNVHKKEVEDIRSLLTNEAPFSLGQAIIGALNENVLFSSLKSKMQMDMTKQIEENKTPEEMLKTAQKTLEKHFGTKLTKKEESKLLTSINQVLTQGLSSTASAKQILDEQLLFKELELKGALTGTNANNLEQDQILANILQIPDYEEKTKLLASFLRGIENKANLITDFSSFKDMVGLLNNHFSDYASFSVLRDALVKEICPKVVFALEPQLKSNLLSQMDESAQNQYALYNQLFQGVYSQKMDDSLGLEEFKNINELMNFTRNLHKEDTAKIDKLISYLQFTLQTDAKQYPTKVLMDFIERLNPDFIDPNTHQKTNLPSLLLEKLPPEKLSEFMDQMLNAAMLVDSNAAQNIKKMVTFIGANLPATYKPEDKAMLKEQISLTGQILLEHSLDDNYVAEKVSLNSIRKELTHLEAGFETLEAKRNSINSLLTSFEALIHLAPESRDKTASLKLINSLKKELLSGVPDTSKILANLRNASGLINKASGNKLDSLDQSLGKIMQYEAQDLFDKYAVPDEGLAALVKLAEAQPDFASEIFSIFLTKNPVAPFSENYTKLLQGSSNILDGMNLIFAAVKATGNPKLQSVISDLLQQITPAPSRMAEPPVLTALKRAENFDAKKLFGEKLKALYQSFADGGISYDTFLVRAKSLADNIYPADRTPSDFIQNQIQGNYTSDDFARMAHSDTPSQPLIQKYNLQYMVNAFAINKIRSEAFNPSKVNEALTKELLEAQSAIDQLPPAFSPTQRDAAIQTILDTAANQISRQFPKIPGLNAQIRPILKPEAFVEKGSFQEMLQEIRDVILTEANEEIAMKTGIDTLKDLMVFPAADPSVAPLFSHYVNQLSSKEKTKLLEVLTRFEPGDAKESDLKVNLLDALVTDDLPLTEDFVLANKDRIDELAPFLNAAKGKIIENMKHQIEAAKTPEDYKKIAKFLALISKERPFWLDELKEIPEIRNVLIHAEDEDLTQILLNAAEYELTILPDILKTVVEKRPSTFEALFTKVAGHYKNEEAVNQILASLTKDVDVSLSTPMLKRIVGDKLLSDLASLDADPTIPDKELVGLNLFRKFILPNSESVREWFSYFQNEDLFRQVLGSSLPEAAKKDYEKKLTAQERLSAVQAYFPDFNPGKLAANFKTLLTRLTPAERLTAISKIRDAKDLEQILTSFEHTSIHQEIEDLYTLNPQLLLGLKNLGASPKVQDLLKSISDTKTPAELNKLVSLVLRQLDNPEALKTILSNLKNLKTTPAFNGKFDTMADDLMVSLVQNQRDLLILAYPDLDVEDQKTIRETYLNVSTKLRIPEPEKIRFMALLLGFDDPFSLSKSEQDTNLMADFNKFKNHILQNAKDKQKLEEIKKQLTAMLGSDTTPGLFVKDSMSYRRTDNLLILTQVLLEGHQLAGTPFDDEVELFENIGNDNFENFLATFDLDSLSESKESYNILRYALDRLTQIDNDPSLKDKENYFTALKTILAQKAFVMSQRLLASGVASAADLGGESEIKSLYTQCFYKKDVSESDLIGKDFADLTAEDLMDLRTSLKESLKNLDSQMLAAKIRVKDMVNVSKYSPVSFTLAKSLKATIANLDQFLVTEKAFNPDSLKDKPEDLIETLKDVSLTLDETKSLNEQMFLAMLVNSGLSEPDAKAVISELFKLNEKFRTRVFPVSFTPEDTTFIIEQAKVKKADLNIPIFQAKLKEQADSRIARTFNLKLLTQGLSLSLADIPPDLLKEQVQFFTPGSSIKSINDLKAKFPSEPKTPQALKGPKTDNEKLYAIFDSILQETPNDTSYEYQSLVLRTFIPQLIEERKRVGLTEEGVAKRKEIEGKIASIASRLKAFSDKDPLHFEQLYAELTGLIEAGARGAAPEVAAMIFAVEMSLIDNLIKAQKNSSGYDLSVNRMILDQKEQISKLIQGQLRSLLNNIPQDEPARKERIEQLEVLLGSIMVHSNPVIDAILTQVLSESPDIEIRNLAKMLKIKASTKSHLEAVKEDFEAKFIIANDHEFASHIRESNVELGKYLATLDKEDRLFFSKEYFKEMAKVLKEQNKKADETNFSSRNMQVLFARVNFLLSNLSSLSTKEKMELSSVLAEFVEEITEKDLSFLPTDRYSLKAFALMLVESKISFGGNKELIPKLMEQLGSRHFDELYVEMKKFDPEVAKEFKKVREEKRLALLGTGFSREVNLKENEISHLIEQIDTPDPTKIVSNEIPGSKKARKSQLLEKVKKVINDPNLDDSIKVEVLRRLLDKDLKKFKMVFDQLEFKLKSCVLLSYCADNGQFDKLFQFSRTDQGFDIIKSFFEQRVKELQNDELRDFETNFFNRYNYLYKGENLTFSSLIRSFITRCEQLELQDTKLQLVEALGVGGRLSLGGVKRVLGKLKSSGIQNGFSVLAGLAPDLMTLPSIVNYDLPTYFFSEDFRRPISVTRSLRTISGDGLNKGFVNILKTMEKQIKAFEKANKKDGAEFKKRYMKDFLCKLLFSQSRETKEEIYYREELLQMMIKQTPEQFLDLMDVINNDFEMKMRLDKDFVQGLYLLASKVSNKEDLVTLMKKLKENTSLTDVQKEALISTLIIDVKGEKLKFDEEELVGIFEDYHLDQYFSLLLKTEDVLGKAAFEKKVLPLLTKVKEKRLPIVKEEKQSIESKRRLETEKAATAPVPSPARIAQINEEITRIDKSLAENKGEVEVVLKALAKLDARLMAQFQEDLAEKKKDLERKKFLQQKKLPDSIASAKIVEIDDKLQLLDEKIKALPVYQTFSSIADQAERLKEYTNNFLKEFTYTGPVASAELIGLLPFSDQIKDAGGQPVTAENIKAEIGKSFGEKKIDEKRKSLPKTAEKKLMDELKQF